MIQRSTFLGRSRFRRLLALALSMAFLLSFLAIGPAAAIGGAGGWVTIAPNPAIVHVGASPTVPPGTTVPITVNVNSPGGYVIFAIGVASATCTITVTPSVCNVPLPTYLEAGKSYLLQATYVGPGYRYSHTQTWAVISP